MPMIRHNEAFRKLHEYYTTRTGQSVTQEAIHRGSMWKTIKSVTWNLYEAQSV